MKVKEEKEEKEDPKLKLSLKDEKKEDKLTTKNEKEEQNEDPKFIAKRKLTFKDGILTLIGNEFHRIGFGCLMVIHNLTTYLISYLRHYQEEKSITLQYTYFIGPVMSITMGLFTPCVGIIENKIGLKLSLVLGGILNLWSSVILYFSKNYYFDLFAFFVNSLGSAMSALLSRNLMGYFFHVRGKLSGILSVIGSLVSAGYNEIGEKWIVNPNSEEATVDKSYYTYDVSKNLLVFLRISWICIIVATTMTVIFIVPFDKKKHIKLFKPKRSKEFYKKNKNIKIKGKTKEEIHQDDKIGPLIPEDEKIEEPKEKIEEENEKELKEEERDIVNELKPKEKRKNKKKKDDFSKTLSVPFFNISSKDKSLYSSSLMDNISNEINNEENKNYQKKRSHSATYTPLMPSKTLLLNLIPEIEVVAVPPLDKPTRKKFSLQLIKQALKSRRVLFLFLMGLFSAPLGNFLMSTWRPIGIRKGIPTIYLQNIGTYRPFITCGATLIFSTLSDYIPFRYMYFGFSLLATIIGVTFCFTFRSPGFFTFIILLNSIVFSGKMSITSPHYMKVFGLKYYIEIGGVIGLSRVFMSPLCTVFIFLFETYIAAPEDGQDPAQVSDMPYIILFVTTGLLNIVSAVLSLFETEELFQP